MQAPRSIRIPHFVDDRGSLSVVEWEEHLPFKPKRFYWIDDTAPATRRGFHCHWKEEEVVLALRGSFTILTDDGNERTEHYMNRPDVALYIPASVWHELYGFSGTALCAVFASEANNPNDCCRDYREFLLARNRAL